MRLRAGSGRCFWPRATARCVEAGVIRPEAVFPAGQNTGGVVVAKDSRSVRLPFRKLGGEAIFRAGQQLQFGLMRQAFVRIVVAIQLDYIHVVEVGEFAVDGSDVLAVFEPDGLTFRKCHAGRVGRMKEASQSLERGRG